MQNNQILKLGLPKGSLQDAALAKMAKAGLQHFKSAAVPTRLTWTMNICSSAHPFPGNQPLCRTGYLDCGLDRARLDH